MTKPDSFAKILTWVKKNQKRKEVTQNGKNRKNRKKPERIGKKRKNARKSERDLDFCYSHTVSL